MAEGVDDWGELRWFYAECAAERLQSAWPADTALLRTLDGECLEHRRAQIALPVGGEPD